MSVQPLTALTIPTRPADEVMRLDRMGASFPHRLSFSRALIRRLAREETAVERPVWDIDADGFGRAVYTLKLGEHNYSLVAFSHALDDACRSDRVIATAWDAAFVLYDGVPTAAEVDRLAANAPLQEAGRFSAKDLVISRANKSVRLFNQIADALRTGAEIDRDAVRATGYLMRTTAVYGNGKFGIADRFEFADRDALAGPFAAEMLTVWLIRGFTHDLIEHVGGAKLPADIKRFLGVGNATGLGMAPFLVSHPHLIHAWFDGREQALASVLADGPLSCEAQSKLRRLLDRARAHVDQWTVADTVQQPRIEQLRRELASAFPPKSAQELYDWSQERSLECQELVVSLLLELSDDDSALTAPTPAPFDSSESLNVLRADLAHRYRWALAFDFDDPDQTAQFWYSSAEKLEPRIGKRHAEPGAEWEMPLDIARQVQALFEDLKVFSGTLAEFLVAKPQHRAIVRRVQSTRGFAYAEIQDNLIDAAMRPIDLLRAKLAFFGASKFDPKSDLWTRITLFQGAPTRDTIGQKSADDWLFPVLN